MHPGDHQFVPALAGYSLSALMPVCASLVSMVARGGGGAQEWGGGGPLQDLACHLPVVVACCSAHGPKEGFAFYYQSLDKRDLGQSKHGGRKNKGN